MFDDESPEEEKAGTCLMNCAAKAFPQLKEPTQKAVWAMLEWKIGDAGNVKPKYEPVKGKLEEVQILYDGMPKKYDAFGPKTLSLGFKARPKWKYYQKVELFFKTTGKSASKNGGANVKEGDPNWYVYWQQVAGTFGFGPQCGMVYNAALKGSIGESASYETTSGTFPQGPLREKLTLYDDCKKKATVCIFALHHENGHRQSKQLPSEKGGWGPDLLYIYASDWDLDQVPDDYEIAHPELGYKIDRTDEGNKADKDRRIAWDHGLPEGKYDSTTGKGICVRNQEAVTAKEEDIEKANWSNNGNNKDLQ